MTKKKFISRFMAALMAAFIFCLSVVPVSAASADYGSYVYYEDTDFYYSRSNYVDRINNLYNAFVAKGFDPKDYIMVHYREYYEYAYLFKPSDFVKVETDDYIYYVDNDGSSTRVLPHISINFNNGISYEMSDSNLHFFDNYNRRGLDNSSWPYVFVVRFDKDMKNPYVKVFDASVYKYDQSAVYNFNNTTVYKSLATLYFYWLPNLYVGPVKPDDISDSHVYYGFPVGGINKKAFASWLVDEGKESVINSAGYSFTAKQMEALVDVWATYGYHPLSFLSSLTKTFNIVTELKGAIALTQTINQLYRDYQEYLNTYELSKLDDPVNLPHWRTDKEDTTLITDTEEDTTDTSLLRAILRAVVHLPSDIAVHFNYVKTGFNDILFDFQNQINVMADLPDNIGVAVANNINPTLNSIDNSVNAMAVGVADIDANVNAMAVGVADIDANLGDVNLSLDKIDDSVNTVNNSVNSVNGSVNNLDVSLHEINNTLNDGSGSGSGGCSGSRPCTPDLPEAEFDDLYEQSGDFFKFFRDLLDSSGWIPASLFTAACLVAIFMRVWGR